MLLGPLISEDRMAYRLDLGISDTMTDRSWGCVGRGPEQDRKKTNGVSEAEPGEKLFLSNLKELGRQFQDTNQAKLQRIGVWKKFDCGHAAGHVPFLVCEEEEPRLLYIIWDFHPQKWSRSRKGQFLARRKMPVYWDSPQQDEKDPQDQKDFLQKEDEN